MYSSATRGSSRSLLYYFWLSSPQKWRIRTELVGLVSKSKPLITVTKQEMKSILTSVTVLVNDWSKVYLVHSAQHLFSSHVTLGVTQWNLGVPVAKTSEAICMALDTMTKKQEEKYKHFCHNPNSPTCRKISSKCWSACRGILWKKNGTFRVFLFFQLLTWTS